MQTQTSTGGMIDPATIQGFTEEYAHLEALVASGKATVVEQLVYLTAQLALRSARSAEELRKMLEQQQSLNGVVYVSGQFPQEYRNHFMYGGRLYQLLMDALPLLKEATGL